MRHVIKILLFSFICMAIRCEKEEGENCHPTIKIFNNSDKTLYVRYICNYIGADNPWDLSIYSDFEPNEKNIKSKEVNKDALSLVVECIENIFDNKEMIYVCVFDAAVVENTPWNIVARDYLVLRRYDLTLQDLQQLNWSITYPPDERMKDVKMYPPYGE